MAPSVCLMIWATPVFFSAPWVPDGQATVSPLPSFQVDGAAAVRYLVKLLVVPEPSERWATVIDLSGRLAASVVLEEPLVGPPPAATSTNEPAGTPASGLTVLSVPAKSVSPWPNSFLPVPEP